MGLESVLVYVADKIVAQIIKDELWTKRLYHLLFFKRTFHGRLIEILQQTVTEFENRYPFSIDDDKIPFYHSQILLERLTTYVCFEEKKVEIDTLDFAQFPNIVFPNDAQLATFYTIFIQKITCDKIIKNLFTEENYKVKIFDIGQKIDALRISIELLEKQNIESSRPLLPLHLPLISKTSSHQVYSYKYRYSDFRGRNDEFQKLINFIVDDSQLISWICILGDGGIGKSRISLELCIWARANNFDAGFLDRINISELRKFKANKKTLVIIDYAASQIEELIDILNSLYHGQTVSGYKSESIKIILIERNSSLRWLDQLMTSPEIYDCRYMFPDSNTNLLVLNALHDDDILLMVSEIAQKHSSGTVQLESGEQILANIKKIDPKCKPLFIFFIAIAICETTIQNLNNWNINNLLDFMIGRERRRLEMLGFSKSEILFHENLAIVISLNLGQYNSIVKQMIEDNARTGPSPVEWAPMLLKKDLLFQLCDYKLESNDVFWLGMGPSPLVEYFMIKKFRELITDEQFGSEMVEGILQSAWINNASGASGFLFKAACDYATLRGDPGYEAIFNVAPSLTATIQAWNFYLDQSDIVTISLEEMRLSKDVIETIYSYFYNGQLDEALEHYLEIEAFLCDLCNFLLMRASSNVLGMKSVNRFFCINYMFKKLLENDCRNEVWQRFACVLAEFPSNTNKIDNVKHVEEIVVECLSRCGSSSYVSIVRFYQRAAQLFLKQKEYKEAYKFVDKSMEVEDTSSLKNGTTTTEYYAHLNLARDLSILSSAVVKEIYDTSDAELFTCFLASLKYCKYFLIFNDSDHLVSCTLNIYACFLTACHILKENIVDLVSVDIISEIRQTTINLIQYAKKSNSKEWFLPESIGAYDEIVNITSSLAP